MGYQGPTSSSSDSLYSKAPKSRVYNKVEKRFSRGSLGAILWLTSGEVELQRVREILLAFARLLGEEPAVVSLNQR